MQLFLGVIDQDVLLCADLETLALGLLPPKDCRVNHDHILLFLLDFGLLLMSFNSLRLFVLVRLLSGLVEEIALVDRVLDEVLEPLHEQDLDLQHCTQLDLDVKFFHVNLTQSGIGGCDELRLECVKILVHAALRKPVQVCLMDVGIQVSFEREKSLLVAMEVLVHLLRVASPCLLMCRADLLVGKPRVDMAQARVNVKACDPVLHLQRLEFLVLSFAALFGRFSLVAFILFAHIDVFLTFRLLFLANRLARCSAFGRRGLALIILDIAVQEGEPLVH